MLARLALCLLTSGRDSLAVPEISSRKFLKHEPKAEENNSAIALA
jgi:hypothetical protein